MLDFNAKMYMACYVFHLKMLPANGDRCSSDVFSFLIFVIILCRWNMTKFDAYAVFAALLWSDLKMRRYGALCGFLGTVCTS